MIIHESYEIIMEMLYDVSVMCSMMGAPERCERCHCHSLLDPLQHWPDIYTCIYDVYVYICICIHVWHTCILDKSMGLAWIHRCQYVHTLACIVPLSDWQSHCHLSLTSG